jgi:hypothetical protein
MHALWVHEPPPFRRLTGGRCWVVCLRNYLRAGFVSPSGAPYAGHVEGNRLFVASSSNPVLGTPRAALVPVGGIPCRTSSQLRSVPVVSTVR